MVKPVIKSLSIITGQRDNECINRFVVSFHMEYKTGSWLEFPLFILINTVFFFLYLSLLKWACHLFDSNKTTLYQTQSCYCLTHCCLFLFKYLFLAVFVYAMSCNMLVLLMAMSKQKFLLWLLSWWKGVGKQYIPFLFIVFCTEIIVFSVYTRLWATA